ncbi:sugar porter family MFS transporter [Paraneptunicella aestuarii]|uniref:sugar porter family MFS transporter n=1 Tax=Paraneptunicella aestuarii TaxID=2831148 RepID=UPI001E54F2B6|nr:sugar porter family MFS transporter [Paraneptunicella aestuarii]UAA40393.1 sugar porter family MFS transporter [Paraneptunicella aestuarii]
MEATNTASNGGARAEGLESDSVSLRYVIFISAVAAIGGFLFGFDSGVINGTVGALEVAFNASDIGTGFNVASVLLGCAIGALIAGPVADKSGRKPAMLVTAVIFAISALGSGIADSSLEFIFYRLFGGIGVGAASVLAPAYIAEVSPARLRGRLATLQQLAIVIGLFTAFLSNFTIASISGGAQEQAWMGFASWRWMFWMELIPALLFLLGVMMIPESPRYLVAHGKVELAKTVFHRIAPGSEAEQIEDVKQSLKGDHKPRLRDLFIEKTSKLHPIVWVGVALSVFQQFVGINVVFYYGSELWQAAGFDESQSLLINVIGGTTNVVSTFIAIALIDKIGRKPLLLIGSVGMSVMLATLTFLFSTAGLNEQGNLALTSGNGTLALVAANLYIVFFGMSWGPVVWVLLGEMFNNRIRGAALAVAASAQWLANFLVSMTFPVLLAGIGLGGAYGLYAASALISVFFVVKYVHETKGRRLEEM